MYLHFLFIFTIPVVNCVKMKPLNMTAFCVFALNAVALPSVDDKKN